VTLKGRANNLRFRQQYILVVTAALLLAGCGHHYHPLQASKKAKMAAELINSDKQCDSFRKRLEDSAIGDDAIDDVYRDAMKAQCIKKDI